MVRLATALLAALAISPTAQACIAPSDAPPALLDTLPADLRFFSFAAEVRVLEAKYDPDAIPDSDFFPALGTVLKAQVPEVYFAHVEVTELHKGTPIHDRFFVPWDSFCRDEPLFAPSQTYGLIGEQFGAFVIAPEYLTGFAAMFLYDLESPEK